MNLSTMRVGLTGVVTLGVLAWAGPAGSASDPDPGSESRAAGSGAVATCETDVIGPGPADWRRSMKHAGPLAVRKKPLQTGVSKAGINRFVTKLPLLVVGHDPVTLSAPPDMKRRVELDYDRDYVRPARSVTFMPCADKPRTYWGGGIRIRGRRPVRLLVNVAGQTPTWVLRLGRPIPAPDR